jgi:A/G-specific adenine glycosylase
VKIRDILSSWYRRHKRDLPWRHTRDPYAIWVSEIILQQTRVTQGIDYYLRFLEHFPDLKSLADASTEEILKVWQGLGYYSRARNMHAAAAQIIREHKGIFPSTYKEMLKLKGIGPYTAAAIASMAFDEPRAVIDGNVHRVIARIFEVYEPPERDAAKSEIRRHAEALLDPVHPGVHNQAIMEFGALVCTPVKPSCQSCPLQLYCMAFKQDLVKDLPVRQKSASKKNRYFHYLIIRTGNWVLITQRTGKDIWKDLFEFPLIETPRASSPEHFMESGAWRKFFENGDIRPVKISGVIKHTLTHQVIHARFYHLEDIPSEPPGSSSYRRVPFTELDRYPVPKLIENYLNILND